MPIPSRSRYISSLPAASPTNTIAHCDEVVGYFSKLGHASSLYKTGDTGMNFVQNYYNHPSAQTQSPKNSDNIIGHKESCNSDVKVEPYISPKSKHPFYLHRPVKYNHHGSCSAIYFRQDGFENHLAQPPQTLTSHHSITNAVPLGMAPISSSTNRSDIMTAHPTDLWKNPPGVPGTQWSGAVLSHSMSHPSNMSVSCQESQSYNDANTSNKNTSASSFCPSHASQLLNAQIAYQQHASNYINSHSPTLSFPSNGV
ncbi:hypothetical protein EAF00_005920 [Botryotinia globosa]|nr:hypothetical protein EAF00_005920 [Botryotinia globosa]